MSTLVLPCPQCHRALSLPESLSGKRGRCPTCRHEFTVPASPYTSAQSRWNEATVSHAAPTGSLSPTQILNSAPGSSSHPPGFVILSELGKGGMGVVYKAEQTELRRLVALKMIRAADDATLQDRERFRAEAESLARLRHPNIVSIHEVGEHQGRQFFALEYLEGGSLNQKLAGNPQPPREAAELLEKLALAVEAAHQANIIHRDLKPANILLTLQGEPKITDFGLAKQLDVESGQTRTGAIMGTPCYMAPEQAKGEGKGVGPAADIYALGVILYEMLTGRPPFKGATPVDTLLQVAQDDPVPPSHLIKKLSVDLETICLKCLRKEPEQRYRTAGELARELRAFLEGRPIQARPVGVWERTLKWAKRRPATAALLAVSAFATLAFIAVLVYFTRELTDERNNALAEKATAQTQKERADDARQKADKATQDAVNAKLASDALKIRAEKGEAEAQMQLRQTERTLFTAQVGRAASLWQTDPTEGVHVLRDLRICPPADRDFAWHFYHRLCQTDRIRYENGQDGSYSVRVSPDGSYVVSGCHDEAVRIWELTTGRLVHRLQHAQPVQDAIYTPDGKTVITGGWEGKLRVWDAESGEERTPLGAVPGHVMQFALHPKGEWLAVASAHFNAQAKPMYRDGAITLFHLGTKERKSLVQGHPTGFETIDFSADGSQIAVASASGGKLYVLDGALALQGPPSTITSKFVKCVKFSPNGKYIAYAPFPFESVIYLWNRATQKDAGVFRGHVNVVNAIDFSPDGRLLASVGEDKSVRIWDVELRKEILAYRDFHSKPIGFTPDSKAVIAERQGHLVHVALPDRLEDRTMTVPGGVAALQFSPDSKHLASVSLDAVVRVWDPLTGQQTVVGKYPAVPGAVAFAPDSGTLFVAASHVDADQKKSGRIERWDISAKKKLDPWPGHESPVIGLAVSANLQRLASLDSSKVLKLWDLKSGKCVAETKSTLAPKSLFFLPNTSILAAVDPVRTEFFDARDDRLLATIKADFRSALVAPTYDGRQIVAKSNGHLRFWNVADAPFQGLTRQATFDSKSILAHATYNLDVRPAYGTFGLSPDGLSAAFAPLERELRVVDLATGQLRASLNGHLRPVSAIVFSPDGMLLASGDRDPGGNARVPTGQGEIKIWNARPSPFIGHDGKPDRIYFSNNGNTAASFGGSQWKEKENPLTSIIVWDRATGKELFCLCRSEFRFSDLYLLTADGKRLVTLDHDGALRIWDIARRAQIALRKLPAKGHMISLSTDGKSIVVSHDEHGIDFLDDVTLEPIKHWDVPPGLIVTGNYATKSIVAGPDWFACLQKAQPRQWVVIFPGTNKQVILPRHPDAAATGLHGIAPIDDRRLAIGQGRLVTIHDVRTGEAIHTVSHLDGFQFRISPDGNTLICRRTVWSKLHPRTELEVIDVTVPEKRRTLIFPDRDAVSIGWTADELLIATPDGHGVHFWPAEKRTP